jgi:hypothetical protein
VPGSEQTLLRLVAVAILAPMVAACSTDITSIRLLPKADAFVPDSLAIASAPRSTELRPVTAEDLVDQQGQCASTGRDAAVVAAAQPDGSSPAAPVMRGGIALQMTECEVVRRAGAPDQSELGTTDRGERSLVLTYNHGPRPGIYRFAGGRLSSIERTQEQPAPPAPAKPKKPAAKKPGPA